MRGEMKVCIATTASSHGLKHRVLTAVSKDEMLKMIEDNGDVMGFPQYWAPAGMGLMIWPKPSAAATWFHLEEDDWEGRS